MERGLKKKIAAFYEKHGRQQAEIILRNFGISQSMAQKLLAGNYKHQPEALYMRAIEKSLAYEEDECMHDDVVENGICGHCGHELEPEDRDVDMER